MRYKFNKGITLISLVITVVIMLILAAVTINLVIGDNGLFGKAKTSALKYKKSQALEEMNNKIASYNLSIESGEKNEIDNYIQDFIDTDSDVYKGSNDNEAVYKDYAFELSVENNNIKIVSFGENTNLSIEEILDNKDDSLAQIFENKDKSIDFFNTYMDKLCNSQTAMQTLGKSTYGKYIALKNSDYMNSINQSQYLLDFDMSGVCVPILTEDSDKIFVSDTYDPVVYLGWKAFDDWSLNTWYNSLNNGVTPKYIGYDFGTKNKLYKIQYDVLDAPCNNVLLQGANEDNNWETIKKLNLVSNTVTDVPNSVEIDTDKEYSKYRMLAKDTLNNFNGLAFAKLEFYCIQIPDAIKQAEQAELNSMLQKVGVTTSYTIQQVINNQDSVLNKMLQNDETFSYLMKNYSSDIINSQTGMQCISSLDGVKNKCLNDSNIKSKILNSQYSNIFDSTSVSIPIMTQDSDKVIVSDIYSSDYYGWKAYDDWKQDTWFNSANNGVLPKYLGYDFGEPIKLYKLAYNTRNVPINNIKVQGANDDNTWETITTLNLTGNTDNSIPNEVELNPSKVYKKYRLLADTTLNSYTGFALQILQMYGMRE